MTSHSSPAADPAAIIRKLHVAQDCVNLPYTQEIIARCGLPVQVIGERGYPDIAGSYPANLSAGKRHLLLCRNRGAFFKPCPGTKEYRCCGYQVLNTGMNCPMDCVYCILQSYLNNPWLSFFVNVEDLFRELEEKLAQDSQRIFRIGTGEFTDSLALDNLTHFSARLVPFIARQKNAVLELKTKSANIKNLQDLDHGGRSIVAWSLNSPAIMQREELRTASLHQRLEAARKCASWGYRLAFHFDPIILHPGWQEGYQETIRALFAAVPKEAIAWISLGALRYLPSLKQIAALRFPGSRFFYQPFIDGLDGKRRYFREERVEMYRFIAAELQRHAAAHTCLYFCMENDTIWQEVFGFSPIAQGGVPAMLDRSLHWL